jgi:1-acyl-sn-glycerol-3-phosphate acyltransferase
MSRKKPIDKWSLKYWMLKNLWSRQVFNLYYRKIEITYTKPISIKKPIILAPNHQNALMDALAVVIQLPYQSIFLTRADIFKKKIIIRILRYMKMLPIYRIRDGISSLSQNEEIFEETTSILRNKYNPLSIFPEGNHGNKRRLRPLVKGIFRIAFRAQADYGNKPGVQIVPIGIDYSHYQKFRQTLYINIGEPIEVSEFWDQYEENQALATNNLRDRLAFEMRKYMIDIQTEEFYDTYMGLREFYRPEMYKRLGFKKDKLSDRFKADKVLIDILDKTLENQPDKIKTIDSKFKKYSRNRDKQNLRDWVFRKPKYSILANLLNLFALLILSPLYLVGLVNNWPHYFIPAKFVKKIKDPQFRSTAAWGLGICIQAAYYLILAILALVFMPHWWLALIYIVLLPVTGLIAYKMRCWYIKIMARIRYSSKIKSGKELQEALRLRSEIIGLIDSLSL